MGDKPRPLFDDCDLAAETSKHLRKLQAHITSAHHDEVIWKLLKFQDGGVDQIRHIANAWQIRHHSAAAHVDEDSVPSERFRTGLNRMAVDKAPRLVEHGAVIHAP